MSAHPSPVRGRNSYARTGNVLHNGGMKTPLAEPEIVTRKGKPVSVILPIKAYEELLERVEDAEDVAMLKRARKTPLRYRPLEDYLKDRSRQ